MVFHDDSCTNELKRALEDVCCEDVKQQPKSSEKFFIFLQTHKILEGLIKCIHKALHIL